MRLKQLVKMKQRMKLKKFVVVMKLPLALLSSLL